MTRIDGLTHPGNRPGARVRSQAESSRTPSTIVAVQFSRNTATVALRSGDKIHDNVSVVIAEYNTGGPGMLLSRLSERAVLWLAVLGGLLALAITGAVLWLRRNR